MKGRSIREIRTQNRLIQTGVLGVFNVSLFLFVLFDGHAEGHETHSQALAECHMPNTYLRPIRPPLAYSFLSQKLLATQQVFK